MCSRTGRRLDAVERGLQPRVGRGRRDPVASKERNRDNSANVTSHDLLGFNCRDSAWHEWPSPSMRDLDLSVRQWSPPSTRPLVTDVS